MNTHNTSPSISSPCIDVHECELNMDDCSEHANCNNIVGGFTCSCMDGYSGNGRNCVGELHKIWSTKAIIIMEA